MYIKKKYFPLHKSGKLNWIGSETEQYCACTQDVFIFSIVSPQTSSYTV